jgi:hypothetical protein
MLVYTTGSPIGGGRSVGIVRPRTVTPQRVIHNGMATIKWTRYLHGEDLSGHHGHSERNLLRLVLCFVNKAYNANEGIYVADTKLSCVSRTRLCVQYTRQNTDKKCLGYLCGLLFGRLYVVMSHMYLTNKAKLNSLMYMLTPIVMDIGDTSDCTKGTGS